VVGRRSPFVAGAEETEAAVASEGLVS
jgi:hypothetical protein